jgi:hypothetical protein
MSVKGGVWEIHYTPLSGVRIQKAGGLGIVVTSEDTNRSDLAISPNVQDGEINY